MPRKTRALVPALVCTTVAIQLFAAPPGGADRVALRLVDAAVLDTAFTGDSPDGPIGDDSPQFTATSEEPGVTFECRHFAVGEPSEPAFAACVQPFGVGPLADGSWRVEARAVSADAVDETPAFRVVTVDTAAPSVTLDEPAGGTSTSDRRPIFTGTAGVLPGDEDTVTVEVFPGPGAGGEPLQAVPGPRDPLTGAYAIEAAEDLPDGTYTARSVQLDSLGHVGTSATSTFLVDRTGPALSILAPPADGSDPTPEISGVAGEASPLSVSVLAGTDTGSPPIEGALVAPDPDTGAYAATLASELADGTYTAVAEQADAIGNLTTVTRTFKVDTAAPDGLDVDTPAQDLDTPATPHLAGSAGAEDGTDPERSADADAVTVRIHQGTDATGPVVRTLLAPRDGGAWEAGVDPLPEGRYAAQATQADAAGNASESEVRRFRVDATSPLVTLAAPAQGAATSAPVFSGTAGAADGTGEPAAEDASVRVELYAGSAAAGTPLDTLTATRDAEGEWSVAPATPLADGAYTARAEQSDAAGNTGRSDARTFRVDSVAPAPAIAPVGVTSDATPQLSGDAGDGEGDDAEVTVRLWRGTDTTGPADRALSATRSGTAWTLDVDPALADGTYTVRVTQLDAAGNAGQATSDFKVDTAEPVVGLTAPASGLDTNDATPAVAGTAETEDGTHADRSADAASVVVEVFEGPTAGGSPVRALTVPRTDSAWSASVTPALEDGTYTVRARQSDAAGNTGASGARRLKVDTGAPPAALSALPDPGGQSRPAFEGGAGGEDGTHPQRSADAGSVTVEVWSGSSAGGAPARTLTGPVVAGAYSIRIPEGQALADGTWTARTEQSDAAGNMGRSEPRTFKIDTVAPAPALTAPADGADTADATPAVSGTAGSDDGADAARSADASGLTLEVFSGPDASGGPVRSIGVTRSGAGWTPRSRPRSRTGATRCGSPRATRPATPRAPPRGRCASTPPRRPRRSPRPPRAPTPSTPRPR